MPRGHTRVRGSRARTAALTPDRLWAVLKAAVAGWWNDNVPRMGAALAGPQHPNRDAQFRCDAAVGRVDATEAGQVSRFSSFRAGRCE